jgi:AraC-like DNA-binding protein
MDLFAVPEQAIQAFERLSGLRVTVHDLRGTLWPLIEPVRTQHNHHFCKVVRTNHPEACVAFCVTRLRREIPNHPAGRVQVCHAGLVEFVIPVFRKKQLEWVLFAGPRVAGKKLQQAARDTAPPPARGWKQGDTVAPATVNDDEAQVLLENLRQLGARLREWAAEMESTGLKAAGPKDSFRDDLASRRALIRNFIYSQHTQPVRLADLAERLHLSESRATHAVRETCGATFVDLLTEARLRTASALLTHTSLPVLEVALRSGFAEVSHFHRCFRSRFNVTPLQYCKQAETSST